MMPIRRNVCSNCNPGPFFNFLGEEISFPVLSLLPLPRFLYLYLQKKRGGLAGIPLGFLIGVMGCRGSIFKKSPKSLPKVSQKSPKSLPKVTQSLPKVSRKFPVWFPFGVLGGDKSGTKIFPFETLVLVWFLFGSRLVPESLPRAVRPVPRKSPESSESLPKVS